MNQTLLRTSTSPLKELYPCPPSQSSNELNAPSRTHAYERPFKFEDMRRLVVAVKTYGLDPTTMLPKDISRIGLQGVEAMGHNKKTEAGNSETRIYICYSRLFCIYLFILCWLHKLVMFRRLSHSLYRELGKNIKRSVRSFFGLSYFGVLLSRILLCRCYGFKVPFQLQKVLGCYSWSSGRGPATRLNWDGR